MMVRTSNVRTDPVEGYLQVEPTVERDGDTVRIDSANVYYKQLNETVRAAIADGAKTIVIDHVNGQRYIGTGLRTSDVRIEVHGTPGNDMAMLMDGPAVEVFGNAQDGVGNTMNAGKVVVHGDAGDVLGYGMRGGRVFIKGDVGYRVGIHMKAYESNIPIMVCGGKARDFFGEYMAGGLLVLLGMNSRIEGPLVGGYLGTGMHGGTIYLRGEVEPWQCGKEVPDHRLLWTCMHVLFKPAVAQTHQAFVFLSFVDRHSAKCSHPGHGRVRQCTRPTAVPICVSEEHS